jgi:putative mycofactocin binding protein MftB
MEVAGYALHPAVRVREEDFGLLFYNSADTRLTFVRCGNAIQITSADDDGVARLTINCSKERDRERARKVIRNLIAKGIIVDTGNNL